MVFRQGKQYKQIHIYQPQSQKQEENETAEQILRSVDIWHYCPLDLGSASNNSEQLPP